jgi:hypothetical protein
VDAGKRQKALTEHFTKPKSLSGSAHESPVAKDAGKEKLGNDEEIFQDIQLICG